MVSSSCDFEFTSRSTLIRGRIFLVYRAQSTARELFKARTRGRSCRMREIRFLHEPQPRLDVTVIRSIRLFRPGLRGQGALPDATSVQATRIRGGSVYHWLFPIKQRCPSN